MMCPDCETTIMDYIGQDVYECPKCGRVQSKKRAIESVLGEDSLRRAAVKIFEGVR